MSNSIANQNQSLHEDVVQAQVVRVIPINNAHEPEATQLTISDDMKKNVETDIQQLTDSFVKKTDELFDLKEKEIMTV